MLNALVLAAAIVMAPVLYTACPFLFDFVAFAIATMGKAQATILILTAPIILALKLIDWLR